ncbi:tRNA guanosine(34) transglycosylase Tgt [bacterium]|nr:tRNA guanosine(34) transglycosylase Tgt [bacterium]
MPESDKKLFTYEIVAEDPATHARAGVFHTAHGDIQTPVFMPVGTKATVKGMLPSTVRELNAQIVLANTYHLAMRPGADTIAELGGLHAFMNWDRPILTDSGGFQVFSHGDLVKLRADGVEFRVDDYDGSHVFWTPETNMDIQQKLGADIVMQLDQCPPYPAERSFVERAVELSSAWADRCFRAHTRPDQALFGIVQGGMHMDLRLRSLEHLESCGDFPGYGIGGYSVGEDHEVMFRTLEPLVSEHMPRTKPRYLMGVGNPTTLVRGVACGIDMFDCVLPTRTGRMGSAFSFHGRMNLRNARYAHDAGPLDDACTCPVCTGGFSRAYIRHLVLSKEMLGGILLGMHNIYFLTDLMRRARAAIVDGHYGSFVSDWMASEAANDY